MKLYICHGVMEIFKIEREKFGMQRICLRPGWVEEGGSKAWAKVWAMIDAGTSAETVAELKSAEMSIWVLQRCLAELDEQVLVRGRCGFTIGTMTESVRSQATLFVDENESTL